MDKALLEKLRDTAEQHCMELFNQIQSLQTELERSRGDFRTYESLLSNWQEPPETTPDKPVKEKK